MSSRQNHNDLPEEKSPDPGNVERRDEVAITTRDKHPAPAVKSIIMSPIKGSRINTDMIKFDYYNSFNYSPMTHGKDNVSLTLGITSVNAGEGKTTTASNLAVSLTYGSRKRTVLVDLNFNNPQLHKIFGLNRGPGLYEAIHGHSINIFPTSIENLCVVTAGLTSVRRKNMPEPPDAPVGVEHTMTFGDVIYSLEQEFDFVIVDMPAMKAR